MLFIYLFILVIYFILHDNIMLISFYFYIIAIIYILFIIIYIYQNNTGFI